MYPQECFSYHKRPFFLSLPQKDLAILLRFCYYYRYLLVTNYLAIKLLCYLQFQHLQTLPCWKLLVISFCSSLGSTLLIIEKATIDPIYLWVITPFSGTMEWATDLLEIIQTDVCGPMSLEARGGYHFCLTFTDDLSRYGYIYLMKHKSGTF